jgi:putative hydrolase of the HAD superfamily
VRPRRLLVTDADNTLWETNGVYAAAQLDLLCNVERTYSISIKTEDRLQFVREFDQALAFHHPQGLRYPAALLVQTIVSTIRTGDRERSVFDTLRHGRSDPEAEAIANTFMRRISCEVPSLRIGVATAMQRLVECEIEIIVLTEGDLVRCTRLLEQHGLSRHVFATISEEKAVESYAALRRRWGRSDQPVMVGDQIDRDIELSKIAGYTAVHFPGGFSPAWVRDRHVTPDYVITNFEQIIPIMGVP